MDKGIVDAILKFNSNIKLFKDATTTSCILFIENRVHSGINFISAEKPEQIGQFDLYKLKQSKNNRFIKNEEINSDEKWLKYFEDNSVEQSIKSENFILINQIGRVSRGIATGCNRFFCLDTEMINQYGLSEEVCVPCIVKAPDVTGLFLSAKTFELLKMQGRKVYLFDGSKAENTEDIKYIKYGESMNADKAYLTSHRKPWFSIENKEPAPILISVFSRNKIKIVRNEMMIRNLTAFHGLHLNNNGWNENDINILFCYLITPMAKKILCSNKREYGGGLDKFEPNDLNESYIIDINVIEPEDKRMILKIYDDMHDEEDNSGHIEELNRIFMRYV